MKNKLPGKKRETGPVGNRLYTLEVFLFGGPTTERFIKENPVVSRTIQIKGNQTLEDLHDMIFDAFDRWEEHMYEFQIGGEKPMDPKAKQYVLPMEFELSGLDPHDPAGDLTKTTIDSLELKVNRSFGYWFDFGDDWWHQINVIAIQLEGFGFL